MHGQLCTQLFSIGPSAREFQPILIISWLEHFLNNLASHSKYTHSIPTFNTALACVYYIIIEELLCSSYCTH